MALMDAILSPADDAVTKASPGAGASTAAISIGRDQVFAIHGSGALHIKFGTSGMGAAAATDFLLPASTVITYKMPRGATHIRCFNPGGAGIDIYVQVLSRTA